MHRFNDATVPFTKFANASNFKLVSISTGVTEQSLHELESLKGSRVDYITIDVAHGHSDAVARRIEYIKNNFKDTKVIAGNVASALGATFLENAGADAVKVGIGSGVICTTKLKTGFHIPMFTCIQECAALVNCDVIADGGIVHEGDIAKALVAGATMVMAGGIFAACSDSPAEIVKGRKCYFGSTSIKAKKENNHIEGRTINVDIASNLTTLLHEIKQSLQSAVSYAGGTNLSAFNTVNYRTT